MRRGQEPVSTQLVAFNGPAPSDMQTRQNVSLAASILQTRLLTQLRESLGATYGAQASAGISAVPREAYQSTIVFTSEPGQADSLWHAVEETIVDLQTEGPTDAELANAVEQATRSSEQIVRTNGYWVSAIAQRVREDMPLAEMMRWREVLDAVTVDDIRDARVILVPEAP